MASIQAQIPGGAYYNDAQETVLYQRQIPGLSYVDETQRTAAVITAIDTHDGFDEKHHVKKRDAKERLHNQVEEAFRQAFEKPPAPVPVQADAAYFDPLQGFVFPAYRELPKVDDDSDDEDFLLLSL